MPKAKPNNTYYKPSQEEILATRTGVIPANTRKATDKWVQILKNWLQTVGYNYGIKTINNKDQLETEIIEFILGIQQIKNSAKYLPSSLINYFQGPIHDFKLYISKHTEDCQNDPEESWYCDQRLGEKFCQMFMKNICNVVDKEDALSSLINNIELPLKQVDNHLKILSSIYSNEVKPLESKINSNLTKLADKILNESVRK
ncbi:38490_t:CDS:2 [Gigaspora margarita]|uniref:38490_t:CDS:1 n=1 Tax=Gigaspora margarita TaxID=4874 RepID=A0ABN7VHC0_GIGMA|nr:38490_t:CDS:2 [Gigaspora margarita]